MSIFHKKLWHQLRPLHCRHLPAEEILEIHRLPKEVEEELKPRIEAEIYPEQNIDVSSRTADLDKRSKTQCAKATT